MDRDLLHDALIDLACDRRTYLPEHVLDDLTDHVLDVLITARRIDVTLEVADLLPGAAVVDDGAGPYIDLAPSPARDDAPPMLHLNDHTPPRWQHQEPDGGQVRASPLTWDAEPADVVAWLATVHPPAPSSVR
ncbi:hypothetical protein [Cellulomonas cellasea]|uniref:Uncharacterized protein n=1 Tax=Cellulomonas cellasea TaxID=43670 RepID=A0A7W4YD95_9CELL|nr:hypothetical protein [Cellulomonas cellasea]MBB2925568.1 hypothetical protein [Cellulomonas cellasea]